ncbi:MAG: hypothetical protein F6K22_02505 [Okeania sp. SIO2F4]|uniref:DUF6753 family protein n=1 Tax=Okeania sp. SIO2F4 TaxID=2607790 RepID=UPI00142BC96E|nr:DUF6753 family protein [Okeania sp. SIO2F4]NES01794.1 hypothetical protein [Okeania sp. SIO2F4]
MPELPLNLKQPVNNNKPGIIPEQSSVEKDVENIPGSSGAESANIETPIDTNIHDPHSFDNFQPKKLLDQLLEGKPDAYKAKLEALVRTTGVTVDDPIFLILVASGRLELLLDEAPQTLGDIFQLWSLELSTWLDKLKVSMELAQKTSVLEQQAAIASAVANSIKTAKDESSKNFLHAVPWAGITIGGCMLASLSVGFLSGLTVPPYMQGGIAPGSPMKLTRAQANALDWAMSSDGKKAKQIFEWNRDYINSGQCLEDARKLKIEMSYNNRPAKDGFCTLWIKPPQKRGTTN